MNGHYQRIPETRWKIPENCKQHIIVLLAQMIDHRLSDRLNNKEPATKKGREHSVADEVRGV